MRLVAFVVPVYTNQVTEMCNLYTSGHDFNELCTFCAQIFCDKREF